LEDVEGVRTHGAATTPVTLLCSQIEALPDVERAFVHVDHKKRDTPEHIMDREKHHRVKARRAATAEDQADAL
jgi:hypothetical protein